MQRMTPDVLVSDIGMPGQDGYEFIHQVRMLGEPGGRVPAVARSWPCLARVSVASGRAVDHDPTME